MRGSRIWYRGVEQLLRICCNIAVEIRGGENLPAGAALVAAKHLSSLDTFALFMLLPRPFIIAKQELGRIPLFGAYLRKTMLTIDREGGSQTLRKMISESRAAIGKGWQVTIFPEGTRVTPGTSEPFKPGVAALYKSLGVPCIPIATNSGMHWPLHGWIFTPGTVVFEFLPALPPGLPRDSFVAQLHERIDVASTALCAASSARGGPSSFGAERE